ncbi:hypothetical protein XELAEV_18040124mg [Xenopus laevis]|uniref:Uncharacterized protein n=1 Tax=Xenopus laevis TaxID=8355 RepID=A0A974H8Q5_XENLA|nr:hypothetical protein XELAEV_18040124mg [Xenopus laevis]
MGSVAQAVPSYRQRTARTAEHSRDHKTTTTKCLPACLSCASAGLSCCSHALCTTVGFLLALAPRLSVSCTACPPKLCLLGFSFPHSSFAASFSAFSCTACPPKLCLLGFSFPHSSFAASFSAFSN